MPEPVLLVLGGLPRSFTSDDLTALCRPYGNVIFAKVLLSHIEPQGEQLGLVRMETLEHAEQLVDHLHGREMGRHTLSVTLLRDPAS